jgi:hypothetical protein
MLLGLSVVSMVWLLVQGAEGLNEGFFMLLPAALLALPLLAGRYLGERTIERVRLARAASAPRRRRVAPTVASQPAFAPVPRGGLLLASSLATRPPPVSG